jgi:salicylate hydroxylase
VRSIISAVDEAFKWALFDRKPLPRWSVGRVTLLGDACHPMLPFKAQGAAQAIEDGATLAACLAGISAADLPVALRHYETLRLARTARVQGESEANKTRHHLADGPAQQTRDAGMARGGTDFSAEAIGWLYGYDASWPKAAAAT